MCGSTNPCTMLCRWKVKPAEQASIRQLPRVLAVLQDHPGCLSCGGVPVLARRLSSFLARLGPYCLPDNPGLTCSCAPNPRPAGPASLLLSSLLQQLLASFLHSLQNAQLTLSLGPSAASTGPGSAAAGSLLLSPMPLSSLRAASLPSAPLSPGPASALSDQLQPANKTNWNKSSKVPAEGGQGLWHACAVRCAWLVCSHGVLK